MKCKICGHAMIEYAQGTYYLEAGKLFSVPFYYCKNCNTFIRKVDMNSIFSHMNAASYTAIKNEEKFYKARINFFKYIYSIVKKHAGSGMANWLDFGSAYGHFIQFLSKENIDTEGIEIAEQVREYARSKGQKIYETIDAVPSDKKYDVISLIDSLYCSDEPVALVRKLFSMNKENGLLVLRITNRNWIAKFKKRILKKEINLALGDATISYSKKSVTLLLENNGYKIVEIKTLEKGKSLPVKTKLFYIITTILHFLSIGLITLTPGLIIVAKKSSTEV
ncbi:MAG: methyltransferase domain-containing protein [Lentimicrobiaceae bacterium]|nr:methyltransferase domain-containing protein [Lentimicrobiaceae bacterium]